MQQFVEHFCESPTLIQAPIRLVKLLCTGENGSIQVVVNWVAGMGQLVLSVKMVRPQYGCHMGIDFYAVHQKAFDPHHSDNGRDPLSH